MKHFLCVLALIAAVFFSAVARGQSPKPVVNRLVVLTNGVVIHGKIQQTRGGYIVERAGSSTVVPIGQVAFAAENIAQAYRFRRASMTEFTSASHYEMAAWCEKNGLVDDARAELRQSLELNVNNRDARQLAVKLERKRTADINTDNVQWAKIERTEQFENDDDVVPIGGLNRKLATAFVSHVQQILLNSCGNGSCHGGQTKNGLHLTHIPPRGFFRNRVEGNLKSVNESFANNAERMRKIIAGTDPTHHFRRHQPLSPKQVQLINSWAKGVAQHQSKKPQPEKTTLADLTNGTADQPSEAVKTSKKPVDIITRVAAEERPDPFDPEEFNRLR